MNIAEEFIEGRVACEVKDCTQVATTTVKDFVHLFGQTQVAIDLEQVGPTHFFCRFHTRDGYSFKRVKSQLVRF
jgi:hypothetical protein